MRYAFLLLLIFLPGCTGIPDGVEAVDGFNVSRYLGKWYEIARLDHPFERNLTAVTAEYSLRQDGGITVVNSGYDPVKQKRVSVEGKAYLIETPEQGRLKVSFFGPFYASYNIIALDKQDYRYAMVTGPNLDYLWILSRTPQLDEAVLAGLKTQARQLGFAVDELIYVSHTP
ncbi:lipocalin family protein [Methylomarinum vadi]|uniref:lipocalin family protein n=1 Tax=Methylomarinum vadi TaxID=438855 RepID=UPI0004DEF59E|nr:lipocalin family protein [Methylomarinum vadi]